MVYPFPPPEVKTFRVGISLSTTSNMDVHGVSLSTTSNMDVHGVSLSTTSSMDVHGVSSVGVQDVYLSTACNVQNCRRAWCTVCILSTTNSVEVQGVSLSTACSVDVHGISFSTTSSLEVQGVSLSTVCRVGLHFTFSQLRQSGIGIPASRSVRYRWSRISPALPGYRKKKVSTPEIGVEYLDICSGELPPCIVLQSSLQPVSCLLSGTKNSKPFV
jgi:hypothetical protein